MLLSEISVQTAASHTEKVNQGQITSDCEAMDFMRLLNSLDFTQHIAVSTRPQIRFSDIFDKKIVDTNLSDHYCLFFDLTIDGTRTKWYRMAH